MKKSTTKDLVLAGLFLAIGLLLPFLTGQIPEIGSMLLPMHIPVLICGLVIGWKYGLAVGFVLPLLRNLLFGMPPLFPVGIAMAFELAAYGVVIGLLYSRFKKQGVKALYISLVGAMLAGRVVWGIVQAILLGMTGSSLTVGVFMASAFLNAIPGIILQLVMIPPLVMVLRKTKLMLND